MHQPNQSRQVQATTPLDTALASDISRLHKSPLNRGTALVEALQHMRCNSAP